MFKRKSKALISFFEYNWELFWCIQITYFLLYNTHTSCYKGNKIAKVYFSTLQGMRKEISFLLFLKKMTQNYLEKEEFRVIMRKKKLLYNLYLKLRNTTSIFFIKQLKYLSTVFLIDFSEKTSLLRGMREEVSFHMFLKKMTPNYLEKGKFWVITRKKKLLQNLHLKLSKLRNTNSIFLSSNWNSCHLYSK